MAASDFNSNRGSIAWRYTRKLAAFSPTERDALASTALILLDLINAGALSTSRLAGPACAARTQALLLRLNLLEDALHGPIDERAVERRLHDVVSIACSFQPEDSSTAARAS
jgi:hypothetical protein